MPKNDTKSFTVYKEETIYNMQAIAGNLKIPEVLVPRHVASKQ